MDKKLQMAVDKTRPSVRHQNEYPRGFEEARNWGEQPGVYKVSLEFTLKQMEDFSNIFLQICLHFMTLKNVIATLSVWKFKQLFRENI